mgnify:CR=1 FL=1
MTEIERWKYVDDLNEGVLYEMRPKGNFMNEGFLTSNADRLDFKEFWVHGVHMTKSEWKVCLFIPLFRFITIMIN